MIRPNDDDRDDGDGVVELPKASKLRFDMFHDMMHVPFTGYCRSLYGGWRRHLALYWEFRGRRWVRRQTLCRVGRHSWTTWSSHGTVWRTFVACTNCMKEVTEP